MTSGLLIVGGGLAAQRCCEVLRAAGDDRPITIVGAEPVRPYDRPPLSKTVPAGAVCFRPAEWYAERAIELRLGLAACGLEPGRRVVALADGSRLPYDQLLIACGATPRELPALGGFANVQALRTLADAARLASALAGGGPLAVVGAGLIGLEAAATAARMGVEVTVIEAAPRPLAGILGPRAAAWLTALHRACGVVVRTGTTVAAAREGRAGAWAGRAVAPEESGATNVRRLAEPEESGATRVRHVEALELSDGTRVACAHVLVGVGVRPATGWLAGSGLDPAGVLVDEAGRTALPGVFAAGDAACRPDPRTGRPVAGGHWESASREGAAVAAALLGRPARPAGPPSFWSDQHGIRLQCVGDPRDAEEVLAHGDLAGDCFELDHLRDGRITAVLLAGRPPSALRAARARLHVPHIPVRSAA